MIQYCTCNKRLTSSLEASEGQENFKSCRSCGGILSVVERGGLPRRLWSTMGPEFLRIIDSQLKWNISSNGKPRALRRARTFTQVNGKKSAAQDLKDIEDLFDRASKKEGDMLVSESEKLGVSLLSRRFSNNLESFPIKKRIISLLPSHPTPDLLSSSGCHDHDHGSHPSLLTKDQVLLNQDEPCINPFHGVELSYGKGSDNERRKSEYIDELNDSADFSGISILAAAACHSNVDKLLISADVPTVRSHSFEENLVLNNQTFNSELGNDIPNSSPVFFSTENIPGTEPGQMKNEECKLGHSCTLESLPNKSKPVSSRGNRLHWDLNTVMDVWERHPDEDYSKYDLHNTSNVRSNMSHNSSSGNQGPCLHDTEFLISRVGLVAADNQLGSYSLDKVEEEVLKKCVSPVIDYQDRKYGLIHTQVCNSSPGKCQSKEDEEMTAVISDRANLEKGCLVTTNTCAAESVAHLVRDLSVQIGDLCGDKPETNFVEFNMEMDTHNTLPDPVITGYTSLGHSMQSFDNEPLHDTSRSITSAHSCRMEKNYHLGNSHVEEVKSLCTDVAFSVTTQKALDGPLDENAIIREDNGNTLPMNFDSSSKSMTGEGCLSNETAYSDEFGNAYFNESQSTAILLNSEGTYNECACIHQNEDTLADINADDCKSFILSGETLNASKSSSTLHRNPKDVNSDSEDIMLDTKGSPALILPRGECQTPAVVHVKNSKQDSIKEMGSVEECFSYEHHLNTSPIDTDHAIGLEKVDFLGDDDSQFEDGELREAALNSWGDDGAEEVETEHVDYGSDYRDAESVEAESDFFSQSELPGGTIDCKQEERLVSICDGNRSRVTEDLQSNFQNHHSVSDFSKLSYGKGDDGAGMIKDLGKVLDVNVTNEMSTGEGNRFIALNLSTGIADDSGKTSQLLSSRMKYSGWDKLPRREDAVVVPHWHNDVGSVTFNGEPSRKRTVWPIKQDFSCRDKPSKSSEGIFRKEGSCARENRKHDHVDLNAERSTDAIRLQGRSRPFHSNGRGRVWVDTSDHHGSCRFDMSGYYSSPNFRYSGSRNAAAAAVAKVESNGFVVAPDGTIVKSGSLGPGTHLSGHSSKSSAHLQSKRRGSPIESDGDFCTPSEVGNSREVSPGRCFNTARGRDSRYSSRSFSLGHRNKYHAPVHDNRIDSQSLQHPSSKMQQSISPQRRPIHLSHEHMRSPSRSRTRSPHAWTSPRARNNERISGMLNGKRRSRSPLNFNPQRRIQRQRSPQLHGLPNEEFSGYDRPSRNRSSPPHSSRWFDDEKVFPYDAREYQPRRPRGRSPPTRNFSQSIRLDDVDSRGRMKPDEYYEPIYSGRFQGHAGHDRDDRGHGRRGRSNRYGTIHEAAHLESNRSMNCHQYDNDVRAPNLRPKSFGFQGRQSLRTFDGIIDSQNEDSPRRIKGEMAHFRHVRDAKLNSDFKSFKVRDNSDVAQMMLLQNLGSYLPFKFLLEALL